MARLEIKCTYFVFAEKGEMQNNFEGLGVSSEDHKVGHATVESFGGLVGALLQLYHMTRLAGAINSIIRR